MFKELSTTEFLTLSVGDMAHKFSCGRRHLNRLFHQQFGCSVASLRMEIRLLKASSLLRDPDLRIFNVASQCGFNHLGLFNTCFKRRFGKTPGKWRKGTNGEQGRKVVQCERLVDLRIEGGSFASDLVHRP
jgi:transcriptional regulator GlxA family with amidase domain